MQNLKFKVLAPLSNFNWSGNNFQIGDFCFIEKLDKIPDLSWCEDLLSQSEKEDLGDVSHWLSFEQSPDDKLSPSEKINIFLLVLWIALPTRVQVRFRFELLHKSGNGQESHAVRYYDHFQWIEPQAKNHIETKHLQKLHKLIGGLETIYISHQRLWNSLVLTFNGCTTIYWQVAFICFTAAAEGILTYETGRGITNRLAKSFACLTKKAKRQRDAAYQTFKHSYNIRSDIMHGRIVYSAMKNKSKLKELAKFSDLLRKLWKVLILSQAIMAELEKDDTHRKTWFIKIEHGYNPPKI